MAEFLYNNSRHSVTGTAPFFLQGGYYPTLGIEAGPAPTNVPAAQERAVELQSLQKTLAAEWRNTAQIQAKYYDAKHTPRQYYPGDLVWLSGRNLRSRRPHKKLDYKFHGPYKVEEVIGKQAYRLGLPPDLRVHPVFHVSLLEPCRNRTGAGTEEPPPLSVDGDDEWEIEKILDSRVQGNQLQYLVQFTGWSADNNEWVADTDMHAARLKREFHKEHPAKPMGKHRKSGKRRSRQ